LDQTRTPRALLTTIAKGLLIDHFRRSALERTYLEELGQQPQSVQPSAEEQAMALDALREIDRLLGQLSSNARAAFLHNRLDGMGHVEIAERLGVSVSRVRQYLAQGLRQCYIALHGEPQ
jgi:RNA polymerase sigma-70 factor (ECF subfamily)